MYRLFGYLILWIILFLYEADGGPAPVSLKECKNDDHLESCIVEDLNIILPHLATGWERIALPKLDPMILPTTITTNYIDGNMTLDLVLKDTAIIGISKSQVQLVKVKSITEGKIEIMCKTPTITAVGTYSSEGFMSFFPLQSMGHFNITMGDITSAWLIYLNVLNINGTDYFQIDHLSLDVMPLEVTVQAARQLDGDNRLGASLNTYLNENSFELFKLLKTKIMSYFQDIFKITINTVLLSTPKEFVLPGINVEL